MPNSPTVSLESLIGSTVFGLRFAEKIGSGAFGSVFLAEDLEAKSLVAVKVLSNECPTPQHRHFLQTEVNLHRRVSSHPNIVTLHRVVTTNTLVFIVLSFIPGCDLFDQIVVHHRYLAQDRLISKVYLQIVEAVGFLHDNGIAHRDLKPENILCSEDGEDVYLADFGLATTAENSREFQAGSSFYLSPECRNSMFKPYTSYNTPANDVWALGVLLVTLACGLNPWREASLDDESFRSFLRSPDAFLATFPLSPEASELLKHVFEVDPRQRITVTALAERVKEIKRWTTFDATSSNNDAETIANVDDEMMEPIASSSPPPPPPTSPLDPFLHLPTLLKFDSSTSSSPSPPTEPLPATPSDFPSSPASSSNKLSEIPTTPSSTDDSSLGVNLFSPSTPSFDFSSSCSNSSCGSSVGSFDHRACDDADDDEEDAEGSSSRSLAELLQGSIFPTPPTSTPKDRASRRIFDFQQPFFPSDNDVEMMGEDDEGAPRRSWARRRSGTL